MRLLGPRPEIGDGEAAVEVGAEVDFQRGRRRVMLVVMMIGITREKDIDVTYAWS